MGDITLRSILSRSRRLQRDFYKDDELLESHLAQGLIKNAASLIDPYWNTNFLDMDQEIPITHRKKLLYAVDCLLYASSLISIQDIDMKSLLRVISSRQKMIRGMHDTAEKYKKIPPDKNIVVLDIDGVIFPYPDVWNKFKEAHINDGIPIEEIKEQYRLSGIKSTEPPIKGAADLISFFQEEGCIVALLSSRPVNIYPEVYIQTISFLSRYNMEPDLVFFKDHKPVSAELDSLWERVVFFVDDEGDYLIGVKEKHENVCCVHITPYNDERATGDFAFRTTNDFYLELKKKNFDAVKMIKEMKEIRDKLSKQYIEDPEMEDKALEVKRGKYGNILQGKQNILISHPISYSI